MTVESKISSNEPIGLEFTPAIKRGRESIVMTIGIVKRNKWLIVATALLSVGLGVFLIAQSVTKYTSTASVMIDTKQVGVSASAPFIGALAFDTGAVDSQVVLIQSDSIASSVIDHLDLLHNPAFIDPPQSWLGYVALVVKTRVFAALRTLGLDIPEIEFAKLPPNIQRTLLIEQLQDNLKVTRNARTYVIDISYTDPDPALARSIAQSFASAYLEDQLESRYEASRRAAEWLDERTAGIKAKADAAAAAADAFRAKHQLTQASGRLINEQALTDANTSLGAAKNDLSSAQAKYDRLKQIVDSKDYSGSSLDALSDPVLSTLQQKYLDAYKMNEDISSRIGPKHETAVKARRDMDQYSELIFSELSRLLDSYASEVKIASERVETLKNTIERERGVNDVDSLAMAKLNELQQEATGYINLYNIYIQRAQDLVQQNSIPVSDARIISDADFPILPSRPRKILILLACIAFGTVAGAGSAYFREYRERGFRTSSQVREELGLRFISYIPKLPNSAFLSSADSRNLDLSESDRSDTFRSKISAFDSTLDDAMSLFAESLRSIKLAIDYKFGSRRTITIGFISAFPNEGKSTAAKNFASLLALKNEKVLLIDCDMRNPHLTQSLTPLARAGLLEVLVNSDISVDSVIYREQSSKLAFLPASARGRMPATGDILSSAEMANLMKELRARFSIIVVDFAPIAALTDASAAVNFIDSYQLFVEWGKTPRAAVVDALAMNPVIAGRILGVSLTKVALGKLEQFEGNHGYGYGLGGSLNKARYFLS